MSFNSAPGVSLEVFKLQKKVVSCSDAAKAKGLRLAQELKTLVLSTDFGFSAVSIPGNCRLSLRKVKVFEDVKQAYIASQEDLAFLSKISDSNISMSPGSVTPLLEPLWSMRQLLDETVFEETLMSTNNGTHLAYVKFNPEILLKAPNLQVGNFIEDSS